MIYLPDDMFIDINNRERIVSSIKDNYFTDIIIIGINEDRDEKFLSLIKELKEFKLLDRFLEHGL